MTRLRVYRVRAIIRKWGLYVPFLLTCRTVHCFESQVRRASLYAPCLARAYFLALSVALRDNLSTPREMKHFLFMLSKTIGKGLAKLRRSPKNPTQEKLVEKDERIFDSSIAARRFLKEIIILRRSQSKRSLLEVFVRIACQ